MKVQRRFKNMNIFGRAARLSRPRWGKQILISLASLALLFATWPQSLSAYQDTQAPPQAAPAPPYTQQTPEQLQQLVAPIALYPDSLVAQILAASTFPEQVVEADRWVQANPDLKGDALAQAVDQQPWDPSVKALTAFPSVLGNMDKNLSWTSSLGDAYYNQEQDVMDAIQVMRQRAEEAGNLKTTPQQTVTAQGSTIIIEPAEPDIVYVPMYDPWLIFGAPILAWPGWYPYPGIWFGGSYISFGIGFGISFFGGFGWGWPHWGFNWAGHFATFGGARYYSRSTTFYNRNAFYRGGGVRGGVYNRPGPTARAFSARGGPARGGVFNHPGVTAKPFDGNTRAARGYAAPRGQSGVRSGVFSGIGKGGQTRSFSSRGMASFGGGGIRGGGVAARAGGAARSGGGRR
jgi:hypothetical protein